MTSTKYLKYFFGMIAATITLCIVFNMLADIYILRHRAGASVQLESGFERVLKPAWLASIQPDTVFIGSSRMRMGFDPTLIDKEFNLRSFNYGISSATAYETRRFIQDAAAQPSVKTIFIGLDAFSAGSQAQPFGGGFDETRLAVTPEGEPTKNRALWLFNTRYLTGGSIGMHGLGIWMLARLNKDEMAHDRADIFTAYNYMNKKTFDHQITRRAARGLALSPWQADQFRSALSSLCKAQAKPILFFPPDHLELIKRYQENDAKGFAEFKSKIHIMVENHNAHCPNKAVLFDFLTDNPITRDDKAQRGKLSPYYVDPVHFRPATGLMLLRHMLQGKSLD